MTALAVDPAGLKVACHGTRESYSNQVGYIFVLDAETGATVSGMMKMTHTRSVDVRSAGFILNNDGNVYLTKSSLTSDSLEDRAQFIGYNSLENQIIFSISKENNPSKVLSMAHNAENNDIYLGGSYEHLSTGFW